jgi:hypothetical protein
VTGQQLETDVGGWTDAPDSFVVSWSRCDANGTNCVTIPGAGGVFGAGRQYTLAGEDIDHTIRSSVRASNADDPGAEAVSPATPLIRSSCVFFADFCNVAPDPALESDPSPFYYTNGNAIFSWATDQAHSPTHSLKIVSNQPSGALSRWMSVINRIPADFFHASVYLKTQAVDHGYAQLCVSYWRSDQSYAGVTTCSTDTLTGSRDWTLLTVLPVSVPGSAFARLEFRLFGPGTLWADDVRADKLFGAPI